MERLEQIENLQYQIKKIDGETLGYNIGNRIYGVGKVGFQALLYYMTDQNPWSLLYLPIAIDGLGDVITGKHHFLTYRLFRIHPKYKLEKVLAE